MARIPCLRGVRPERYIGCFAPMRQERHQRKCIALVLQYGGGNFSCQTLQHEIAKIFAIHHQRFP